jgi:hypothetical protein
MKVVEKPMDISPFFDEAQTFVKRIASTIPLTSAILDDWNSGYLGTKKQEKIKGARIIYGSLCVENCHSQCELCSLFRAVGVDSDQRTDFRTTLCFATKEYLDLLPSKQRCLNCKTLEQYQAAFIEYIYQRCDSQEALTAEIDWVKGFRILFLNGIYDEQTLKQKERESKAYIIHTVLERMKKEFDPRQEFVFCYAKEISLI